MEEMNMFDYFDEYEPQWEPSEADDLFNEIKSKLIDAAKDSLKSDMQSLRSRNEYLEKRNKELESRERKVNRKEQDLECKANNLRREVEREFYKTAIDDLLKDAIDKSSLWFANSVPHERPKCNKCNENREWVLTWPNGETSTKRCDCANPIYYYEPQEACIEVLKYKVKDGNYVSERYYKLEGFHKPIDLYDCAYGEFRIISVYDTFCEDTKKQHEELRYGQHIGFTNKEACQEYCDWRNKSKNNNDDDEDDDYE